MSPSMNYILRKMKPFWYDKNIFMDFAGFKESTAAVYTVEENYMDVIDQEYYLPTEFDQELVEEAEKAGVPIP